MESVERKYAFIEKLERILSGMGGGPQRQRLGWWVSRFKAMKEMELIGHLAARRDKALGTAEKEKDEVSRRKSIEEMVIPLQKELVKAFERVFRHLLGSISSKGEMGTIANFNQHIVPVLLLDPARRIGKMLGRELPACALPSREYTGRFRVFATGIVPWIERGKVLKIKARVLSREKPVSVRIFWRELGGGGFHEGMVSRLGRNVYLCSFNPGRVDFFEFYLEAEDGHGKRAFFPGRGPDDTIKCFSIFEH